MAIGFWMNNKNCYGCKTLLHRLQERSSWTRACCCGM